MLFLKKIQHRSIPSPCVSVGLGSLYGDLPGVNAMDRSKNLVPRFWRVFFFVVGLGGIGGWLGFVFADQPSSYAPVVIHESFEATAAKMQEAKPAIEKRQAKLLEERYDLADRPAAGVAMSRQADSGRRTGETARRHQIVARFGGDVARGNS
jgi:hypothetical protein